MKYKNYIGFLNHKMLKLDLILVINMIFYPVNPVNPVKNKKYA